jgi:hypothetical protein
MIRLLSKLAAILENIREILLYAKKPTNKLVLAIISFDICYIIYSYTEYENWIMQFFSLYCIMFIHLPFIILALISFFRKSGRYLKTDKIIDSRLDIDLKKLDRKLKDILEYFAQLAKGQNIPIEKIKNGLFIDSEEEHLKED